ncbi:MAG: hypoxanthine phosphoribosyltransferase [Desulfotomaculales bacterium]
MRPEVESVLITADDIAARVKELGEEISRDFRGAELLVVGILKGSVVFVADLIRHLKLPIHLDFVAVSSYGTSTTSSGVVRFLKDLDESIEGRNVLVVDDIIDTGLTLRYLLDNLSRRQPAVLKLCVLLDKPSRRKTEVPVDYRGFTIPDAFVAGYGLDCGGWYRNLPDIWVVKTATAVRA